MHDYLRAIGFDHQMKKSERNAIIAKVIQTADEVLHYPKNDQVSLIQYNKDFGDAFGLSVVGEIDKDGFEVEYVYPYVKGKNMYFHEEVMVEKHTDKNSFAGICDNVSLGVPLIFYIHNFIHYLNMNQFKDMFPQVNNVIFSGLSYEGTIILNVAKDDIQMEKERHTESNRKHLLEAAREGSMEAIEMLTLEDMDTYTIVSNRVKKEDVYTIVDSYCIPYGVETDKYSILGTIYEVAEMVNEETGEELYYLSVGCNDLEIDVCINKKDLFGEPMRGRRFKGTIWLQGMVDYI